MRLIYEQVKRLLDRNALVLGAFVLLGVGMSSTIQAPHRDNTGMLITLMKLEGVLILFMVIVTELAKSSVIPDKQSKRMEFLLANGVSRKQLLEQYACSLYLPTLFLLLPALIIYVLTTEIPSDIWTLVGPGILLFGLGILYVLFVIYYIIYTVNLNRLNGIQLKGVLLSILLIIASQLFYHYFPMVEYYIGIKLVIVSLIILVFSRLTTTERIVRSYY